MDHGSLEKRTHDVKCMSRDANTNCDYNSTKPTRPSYLIFARFRVMDKRKAGEKILYIDKLDA